MMLLMPLLSFCAVAVDVSGIKNQNYHGTDKMVLAERATQIPGIYQF